MQALDFMAENSVAPERAHQGGLGEVVHENVVAFLGIGPEIEDLGTVAIYLGTLPSQVAVQPAALTLERHRGHAFRR